MTSLITRLVAGVALVGSMSMPAFAAAIRCGPHELVTSMLAEQYQEQRQSIGLSETGLLMEVFASTAGSWTILLTSPGGLACIIAVGDGYEKAVPATPEA